MSLFAEGKVQALCARLLDSQNEKGCLLDSKHGCDLKALLQARGGLRPVGRSARYVLTEAGRAYLIGQLAQVVPPEQNKGEQLRCLGVSLPSQLNQASFNAIWYGDSKRPWSDDPGSRPVGMRVTQDEVIRLRTLTPLVLIDRHGQHHDMTAVMTLLGELALPERALATLTAMDWQGEQIITVENKGAFVDYPLQPGQLLLFAPGRNTSLAKILIPLLPAAIPWAHFGDLDQRGLDIATELAAALQRPLRLWLPIALTTYIDGYARSLPRGEEGSGKIPWREPLIAGYHDDELGRGLQRLAVDRVWLEQEVLLTASRWQAWRLPSSQDG